MARNKALVVFLLLLLLGAWAGTATAQGAAAPKEKFDAQGNTPPSEDVAKAVAKAATSKACLQLHNGSGVTWKIEVNFNPNTYPFPILSGTIRGTICQPNTWTVTGAVMGSTLKVNATRPAGGGCATKVNIVGNFQNPPSYKGTYGFNGASTGFNHTTLFLGYTPCPP